MAPVSAVELATILVSVLAGTLPLGLMVGSLQIKVRRLQQENVRLWRGLFAVADRPIYDLMNAMGADAPVRAAAPDIDNPSERREAT